jgi:4-diphosphocytidyl-2-C-methyl-D-erythritol kinase
VTRWEAPAKVNLSLQVGPADPSGLHPLRSLVQTIEWADLLTIEEGEEDRLVVEGADLPTGGDNLIWKAVSALRTAAGMSGPCLDLHLRKALPVAAGLGGGSSDAAAALLGLARLAKASPVVAEAVAPTVGADVPFLLVGGCAWAEGHGELLERVDLRPDFALAVAVPPAQLSTGEVYRNWDRLEQPEGPSFSGRQLPPSLRPYGPLRNDLTPAAVGLHPELADWISDLSGRFGRPVAMTGSGPGLFAYFGDLDEATSALAALPASTRAAAAALPRGRGVAPAGE